VNFSDCAEEIQKTWNIISDTPILCSITHFIVSALISIFAYRLFGGGNLRYSNEYYNIVAIHSLKKLLSGQTLGSKKNTPFFLNDEPRTLFSHTILTGALTSAIIEIQFSGGLYVPWAVFYALIGPYALRDVLLSFLGNKVKTENKQVGDRIYDKLEDIVENQGYRDNILKTIIQDKLNDIENDLYTDSFSSIKENIGLDLEGTNDE
jgi:hypothetical protein